MQMPFENAATAAHILQGKSVEDLLLLIADNEKGYKPEALTRLLAMGLEENYPVFERAVRNDDDADLRNGAMEVLVTFGVASTPLLIKLLEDDNEEVRNFSAVMLGDIGSNEAVEALIRALGDEDMNVRQSVAEALGKIGDRAAIPPLVNSLKSDFWLQFAAITALGNIGDHQASPHLLEILVDEIWSEPVVDALCKIGDPRTLKPLAELLPQLDDTLSAAVTKALVSIYQQLNESLRFKNSLVEYNKAELKDIISDDGIVKIRKLLANATESETIEAAIKLLGWLGVVDAIHDFTVHLKNVKLVQTIESAIFSIGKAATPHLMSALDRENDDMQIVALHALRWLGVAPEPSKLENLLFHPSRAVQIEALESLRGTSSRHILARLSVFYQHEDEEFSRSVVKVLAGYQFETLQSLLTILIESGEAEKRRRAALLLGHLDGCGDICLIKTLMADPDAEVRIEAIKAAAAQKFVQALPLVHQAMNDPDSAVKENAIQALAGYAPTFLFMEDALALLGKLDVSLDFAIIKAIGMVKYEQAGDLLVNILQDKPLSNNLVHAILNTLGELTYRPAATLIRDHFLNHESPDIRRIAVEVLGRFCDQSSLQGIEAAVHDPHWSVRVAALKSLETCAGIRKSHIIVNALHDDDYLVRKHALTSLGNLRDVKTVSEIVKQLSSHDLKEIACEAILSFGRLALPYLHRLIKRDCTAETREKIIDLIGKIGDGSSVCPLMELLDDPNQNIRLATIDSLAFCFDSVPLKKLLQAKNSDSNDEVRNRADLALKTFLSENYCS